MDNRIKIVTTTKTMEWWIEINNFIVLLKDSAHQVHIYRMICHDSNLYRDARGGGWSGVTLAPRLMWDQRVTQLLNKIIEVELSIIDYECLKTDFESNHSLYRSGALSELKKGNMFTRQPPRWGKFKKSFHLRHWWVYCIYLIMVCLRKVSQKRWSRWVGE